MQEPNPNPAAIDDAPLEAAPLSANTVAVEEAVKKPTHKPTLRPAHKPTPKLPKAPFNRDGGKLIVVSPTQIIASASFTGAMFVSSACQHGPAEGYPIRAAIDVAKKCVVIPAGKFACIRTGLMVDQPIENWTQSPYMDPQAAVSKVAVEEGEVVVYVTGVAHDVTIYDGCWMVVVRVGATK